MSNRSLHNSLFNRLKRETGAQWGDYYRAQAAQIRERLFPQQRDFIEDPSRTKAALCPRRAGKSVASVSYMLDVALCKPDAQVLYITLTRGTAKRIAWSELKKLNRMFDLVDPQKGFHETDLIMRFENGSVIQLAGCETMADVEKFRGGQYDLVIIDECASMNAELFMSLIVDAIMPTLSDRKGTLAIIGTPGRTLVGPFYEATGPVAFKVGPHPDQKQFPGIRYVMSRPYEERREDKWDDVMFSYSFHRWMTKDNVANPGIWEDQQRIKVMNGWADDHPQWRREYLGQWVADDSGFVYRYSADRNDWEPNTKAENQWGLPDDHEWRFVIGIDLGYDDDTAIEVAAWSETSPDFYHLGVGVNMPGLDVAQLAAEVARLADEFDPDVIVADRGGLGKMVVETLNRQYGLPVEAAEKSEKRDHIELLNSDLLRGRCKIRKGSTLAYQMSILQWDERNPKIEDRDTPNHACDAFVYVWRYCYHHFNRKKHVEIQVGSPEYWAEKMREAADKAGREKQRLLEMAWDEKVAEQQQLDVGPIEWTEEVWN
jgi:hypothetical protein